MSTLQTLREALEARGDTVAVPGDAVEVAVRQGYAVRRRRRVAVGVGAAAVAVAVAVPVMMESSDARSVGPAVPSASQSPDPSPSVTATPATPVSLLPLGAPAFIPYAVGNVLVARDLRVELDGAIQSITQVDDQLAVVVETDAPEGITVLDLVSADGTVRELDRGWIYGVVAGQGGSGIAIAWGWTSSLQSSAGVLKAMSTLHAEPVQIEVAASAPAQAMGVSLGRVVYTLAADPGGPAFGWDVQAGTTERLVPDVVDASFAGLTRDGRTMVMTAWADGCHTAYDLESGGELWHHCRAAASWFSPDGRWLVDVDALYDAPTGAVVRSLALTYEWIVVFAWEDDEHVLVGGEAGIDGEPVDGPLVRCSISPGECERVPLAVQPEPGVRIVLAHP